MAYEELENIQLNEYNYDTDKTADFVNGIAGINNANSNTKKTKNLFLKIAEWLKKKADLDDNGKLLSSQLPSNVKNVVEGTKSTFPHIGESYKIYLDTDTNLSYRWDGNKYIEISTSIALGETSSTAFRGDYGKLAYEHSKSEHAPTNAQKNSDITKAEIEEKLTGDITTHTHNIYEPANDNLIICDDETDTSDVILSDSAMLGGKLPSYYATKEEIKQKADLDENGKVLSNQLPEMNYAPTSHTHDDRYYTESEINTKLVDKSNKDHNHSGIYEPTISTKGTAFNKNFGKSSGTVCQGNDNRLSNARPASDVYSWAKTSSKPKYTKSEIGLGNVANYGVTTSVNSSSTTTYATASAVKQAYNNANTKAKLAVQTTPNYVDMYTLVCIPE